MELVTGLLLGLTRLVAYGPAGRAAVEIEPPAALLGAAAAGAPAAAEVNAAAGVLPWGSAGAAELRALGHALGRALGDPSAARRLAELATAVEALSAAAGVAGAPALGVARLRLGGLVFFQALRLLRLGPASGGARMLLVGELAASGRALELPLGLAPPLDGLALAYAAGAAAPRLRSELWVRLPPNPNKARLADWPAATIAAAPRIELYRQRIPGPEPDAIIVSAPAPLPHTLAAGSVTLEIAGASHALVALRTTVFDKFGSPLVVVERLSTTG